MATPPTIPTSFVPKQPLPESRRKASPGSNILLIVSIAILGISALGALGVFGYGRYLDSALEVKRTALEEEQRKTDGAAINDLIRLKRRFDSGKQILNAHTVPSRFFDTLEKITLQNVRFDAMKLSISDDRSARLEMSGVARNFNTLAAQSNVFADNDAIRRAIFSGFIPNKNGTVGFSVTADLDSSVILVPGSQFGGQPQATTTPQAVTPTQTPVDTATSTPTVPTGTTTPQTTPGPKTGSTTPTTP